jgi:hypothetical protein
VGPGGSQLEQRIRENLRINRVALGLALPPGLPEEDLAGNFADLIRQAHISRGERVAVLVDEYDKPLLDHIATPGTAQRMRDALRDLYSRAQGLRRTPALRLPHRVSKFSKVGLFSGLNNLEDITLDARWSALCGYTDADIDSVFAPELPGLDRDEIRRWYNGYNWLGHLGLQPLRCAAAVAQPSFRLLLVRDRHPHLPDAGCSPIGNSSPRTWPAAQRRRAAVELRCGSHRARSAAVPDRLPDAARQHAGEPARRADVHPGLPEPRGRVWR